MPRYSPEKQSFTASSCSWENSSFSSDDAASQDLESTLWSRRTQSEFPQVSRQRHGCNRLPQSRSPTRTLHGHRKRRRFESWEPSGSTCTDAFQSISAWKYTELIQDNLTMALVDELHDDGCLLRERWNEIEDTLADMVAKRLQSVPQGPNPTFDSSYVIRGHRVIRCDDGFSKIFLEDCVAEIRKAWHGLRIRLVHASEIPCEAALAAVQDQRITSSTEDMEQTEENSFRWIVPRGAQVSDTAIQEIHKIPQAKETEVNAFGWIVPRGAQFSDTAIQKIKEFDLTKRKRNRQRFLVPDGLKTWRVTLCGADEIRIGQYTGPAFRKEQPEKTEEDHLKKSHQMEEMNQIEEAQQIMEEEQTIMSQNTDEMIQEDKTPQAKETEVNAFGWIVPRGAQFSDTAIQKIKEFDLTKRKGNRPKFLVPDGLKTWRVTLCGAGGLRIGHYTRSAFRKEQPEETEEDHLKKSHQMEEMNQIEEAQQIMEEEQTIMSQNTDEMIQEDKITQAKETEVNSFGWIVPRGAQFSDTAIQKIKEVDLTKRNGKRQKFLVPDGLKTWRVTLGAAGGIRIAQYTGPAFRKEQPEETEEDHLKQSHQMEEMNQIEESQQIMEEEQTIMSQNKDELSQEDKIPQAKETEVNAFGWIVPRGAQFSDTAIQKIKEFDLTKRKGNRPKFLVPDGLKTWRVALCGAGGIRIGQYTRLALRKEQPEEREVDHVEQSQMEEMNQIEEAKQFTEEKQTIMSQNTDEMIQEDKIPQAKETEVNSFGWIVPRGAQFSDTAIQKIKEFDLTKRKRNRQRFLVPDGLKTWRVTLCGADEIRIGQYTGPAFRKEQPEKTEEDHLKKSHQMEEMNQIEEAQQFTEEKQTNTE